MGIGTLIIAIILVIAVYAVVVMFMPKTMTGEGNTHTQRSLDRILQDNADSLSARTGEAAPLIRDYMSEAGTLTQAVFSLPGGTALYGRLLKSGLAPRAGVFVLVSLALLLLLPYFASGLPFQPFTLLGAVALALYIPYAYIERRIRKRNDAFLNQFPDALDMVVRSVRSGFPLTTALKMIAENMEPPVSTEFAQVTDEIAYGRSINEALARLALRVDRPDIQFFVVVLTVQQEAGGNLAEVLSNLSNIIRKRKQLRMRVRAITSEGRASAWVLAALPVFVFGVLKFISPQHLQPLFETHPGHILLATAIGMVLLAFWIIRRMVEIEV